MDSSNMRAETDDAQFTNTISQTLFNLDSIETYLLCYLDLLFYRLLGFFWNPQFSNKETNRG